VKETFDEHAFPGRADLFGTVPYVIIQLAVTFPLIAAVAFYVTQLSFPALPNLTTSLDEKILSTWITQLQKGLSLISRSRLASVCFAEPAPRQSALCSMPSSARAQKSHQISVQLTTSIGPLIVSSNRSH
jgi:hypothetical protein